MIHKVNTVAAAKQAQEQMGLASNMETKERMATMRLGLKDLAPILGPAVKKAIEEQ